MRKMRTNFTWCAALITLQMAVTGCGSTESGTDSAAPESAATGDTSILPASEETRNEIGVVQWLSEGEVPMMAIRGLDDAGQEIIRLATSEDGSTSFAQHEPRGADLVEVARLELSTEGEALEQTGDAAQRLVRVRELYLADSRFADGKADILGVADSEWCDDFRKNYKGEDKSLRPGQGFIIGAMKFSSCVMCSIAVTMFIPAPEGLSTLIGLITAVPMCPLCAYWTGTTVNDLAGLMLCSKEEVTEDDVPELD